MSDQLEQDYVAAKLKGELYNVWDNGRRGTDAISHIETLNEYSARLIIELKEQLIHAQHDAASWKRAYETLDKEKTSK